VLPLDGTGVLVPPPPTSDDVVEGIDREEEPDGEAVGGLAGVPVGEGVEEDAGGVEGVEAEGAGVKVDGKTEGIVPESDTEEDGRAGGEVGAGAKEVARGEVKLEVGVKALGGTVCPFWVGSTGEPGGKGVAVTVTVTVVVYGIYTVSVMVGISGATVTYTVTGSGPGGGSSPVGAGGSSVGPGVSAGGSGPPYVQESSSGICVHSVSTSTQESTS
jgi:hypothetical protein